jgi:hypothetical protein
MKKERLPLQTLRPMQKAHVFPPRRDYTSLSIKDLLDARDAYHVHLSTQQDVVATAIGRYLFHEEDWYADHSSDSPRPPKVKPITGPRTLNNTVICAWSWPSVLVFVRRWEETQEDVVPRTLYLPDGRSIPTCRILLEPDESLPPPAGVPAQNSELLGGGYACIREHQGDLSAGTIACLVRKGGSYYALTNRHVAGGDGEIVGAYVRGEVHRFGVTSNNAVDRLAMPAAFTGWPGAQTYLTLDAGLVRLDNIEDWTSQAFGIGEIGEVFDATPQSVTLDLIGCPVRAFGGTTGVAEGEIRALFFRFQSIGGFDYATDVLIAPRRPGGRPAKPLTRPGDSGTLWFYDPPSIQPMVPIGPPQPPPERGARARRLRPIAMQWGGQRILAANGSSSAYALGSFLSTICRELNVEVIRNWSTGHDEYWGKIGHFAIGWKACDAAGGKVGQLMQLNQARVGFGDTKLGKGEGFRMGRGGFVPLSDVPDYVWVFGRPNEPVQHFADIDIQDIDGGSTLLDRCVDDPANVSARVWQQYFEGFAKAGVGPEEGCLPFRVWQIWDAMVAYLRKTPKPDLLRFVAAAGVLAHYVGDASQPLHCSYLHHGVPPMVKHAGRRYPVPRDSAAFKAFKKTREAKIHAIYEEGMLEIDSLNALKAVNAAIKSGPSLGANVKSGHDAAVATVQLMFRAQKRLSPKKIINADDPSLGAKARAAKLWANPAVRKGTVQSLADSVRLLANLWETAWKKGGGGSIPVAQLKAFGEDELEKVYRTDKKFVPARSLAEMAKSGKFEP